MRCRVGGQSLDCWNPSLCTLVFAGYMYLLPFLNRICICICIFLHACIFTRMISPGLHICIYIRTTSDYSSEPFSTLNRLRRLFLLLFLTRPCCDKKLCWYKRSINTMSSFSRVFPAFSHSPLLTKIIIQAIRVHIEI